MSPNETRKAPFVAIKTMFIIAIFVISSVPHTYGTSPMYPAQDRHEIYLLTYSHMEVFYPLGIDSGQVTWYANDGNDYEIFLYDGDTVIQLTDNIYHDKTPQIHDGQVTWNGHDGSDYEIFLYNGSSILQLTDNSNDDTTPQIHDGWVAWRRHDGHDLEVFLYNGTSVIQLTNNGLDDRDLQIHGGQVTWRREDGNVHEVYLYDGSTVIQYTDNVYDDVSPNIHDGFITWYELHGSYYAIYLAKPRRCEAFYDSETGTFTTDLDNTLPLLLSIDGERHTLDPGESYSESRSFVLSLKAGWSMVSLPFLPDDSSAESVLSGVGFFQLVVWEGTRYVDAEEFELGKGY